jgi:VanZ family protein
MIVDDRTEQSASRRRVLCVSLTVVLAIIIAVLTLTPAVEAPPALRGADKLYHFLAFGALVLPTLVLLPHRIVLATLLALAYGGLIEIIQFHVGRQMSVLDLLANAAGVATVLALAGAWRLRERHSE